MTDKSDVVTGWRLVELLWPLNDMFRARLSEFAHLPYDADFEAEADEAIRGYAQTPEAGAWRHLSPGAWRVLLERHQQLIVVAMANEHAGNPMLTLPGLGRMEETALRAGLMLFWLLGMKLPFPVADRSHLVLPDALGQKGH